MHQYDLQHSDTRHHQGNTLHHTSQVAYHDFPYSKDVLSQPLPTMHVKRPLPGIPRKLPNITPSAYDSGDNYNNNMQDTIGPSVMSHGLPFATIGGTFSDNFSRKNKKGGGISIGGMGLGFPRTGDERINNYDRLDPHSIQTSPQKRHLAKSQASWHSDGPAPTTNSNKEMNPEPLPFVASEFNSASLNSKQYRRDRSSTVIKKIPLHQRHGDMWVGEIAPVAKPKGIAIHTDRYAFEDVRRSPDMHTPVRNNESHYDFLNRMRSHRKSERREPLNLVMGGQQCGLFERDDIQGELRKLKDIVLPGKAKDLYVGRGFKMPDFHAINKPRPFQYKADTARKNTDLGPKPDYYVNRGPQTKEGNWSKTELVEDEEVAAENEKLPSITKKDPVPEPSSNAVILPREPTFEMGTDPPPRSATTKTATTPNPLRGGPVENFVESIEFEKLKKTFKRLDTDMDGHLQFMQLKTQLPKSISHSQERFIKLVYDITSSSTFFGLNEYISMNVMCQRIASLQGSAKEAYQKLNFATVEQSIKFYTDLFQSVDRSNTGKITEDSLRQILNTALEEKIGKSQFNEVIDVMQVTNGEINKMDFLAYIPYFLSLENLYVH